MRTLCVGTLIVAWGVAIAAAEYREQAKPGPPPEPSLRKVTDNLYVVEGSDPRNMPTFTGGNTGIFITTQGVVLVDTKNPGSGSMILKKVKSVTDKPVTTIINTHTHFDHAGSNGEFPATVEVVAHENVKKTMMQTPCPQIATCYTGDNAKFLPKRTVKDKLTLFSGKDQIDLYHFGPGHTNGDVFVVFPALRMMQAGDMFQLKWLPFIDPGNGGSGVAFPETLKKAIAGIKNVDTVITGHGPVLKWRDFEEHAQILADFLAIARKGISAGQTPEQLAKAYKLPAGYESEDDARTKGNFEMIYKELKAR
jgi:cyclase